MFEHPLGGPGGVPERRSRTSSSSSSSAASAIAEIGCRTVVSSGQTVVAGAVSSKPTMLRSCGTSSPLRWATLTAAAAMSSLQAKIAVGGSGRASSRSVATRPERKVK